MSLRFDLSPRAVDRGLLESDDGNPSLRALSSLPTLTKNASGAEAFSSLPPVDADDRRIEEGERRARFPNDRAVVEDLLDFEGRFATETDAWLTRLHGIEEFAVFASGKPLYRSIPHETHIRDVNAAAPGFVTTAANAVADYRGGAVLPIDPPVEWHANSGTYEIRARALLVSGTSRSCSDTLIP